MSKRPARSDASVQDESPIGGAAIVVDTRGHRCPIPTLRLRRALDAAPPDAQIVLLADDPLARLDVPHFLAGQGYPQATIVEVEGALQITVRKQREEGFFP
jgi:tRNA 2-thiouridine synthesizing protein A